MYRKQKSDFYLGTQLHRKLAIAAVKHGKPEIAFRNWRLAGRTSLCSKDHRALTKRLRKLGLADQIDAYYREVKEKLPEFRYQPGPEKKEKQ